MPHPLDPHPLDHARRCYEVHTEYGLDLAERVPADRFAERPGGPGGGLNPPVWLLGHVAVVGNFALTVADAEPVDLPGWRENFGKDSEPLVYTAGFTPPTGDALRAAVRDTHDRVLEATATLDAAFLNQPVGLDRLADRFPKKGDLLTHLLTTHDAVHWGQLSAWRRAAGLPRV